MQPADTVSTRSPRDKVTPRRTLRTVDAARYLGKLCTGEFI
jgi:hypothetical protein